MYLGDVISTIHQGVDLRKADKHGGIAGDDPGLQIAIETIRVDERDVVARLVTASGPPIEAGHRGCSCGTSQSASDFEKERRHGGSLLNQPLCGLQSPLAPDFASDCKILSGRPAIALEQCATRARE